MFERTYRIGSQLPGNVPRNQGFPELSFLPHGHLAGWCKPMSFAAQTRQAHGHCMPPSPLPAPYQNENTSKKFYLIIQSLLKRPLACAIVWRLPHDSMVVKKTSKLQNHYSTYMETQVMRVGLFQKILPSVLWRVSQPVQGVGYFSLSSVAPKAMSFCTDKPFFPVRIFWGGKERWFQVLQMVDTEHIIPVYVELSLALIIFAKSHFCPGFQQLEPTWPPLWEVPKKQKVKSVVISRSRKNQWGWKNLPCGFQDATDIMEDVEHHLLCRV